MQTNLDKYLTLWTNIWQEAKNQGFTKVKFCERMDISRQTLDNWIKDDKGYRHEDINKASKILDKKFTDELKTSPTELIITSEMLIHQMGERIKLLEKLLANCEAQQK